MALLLDRHRLDDPIQRCRMLFPQKRGQIIGYDGVLVGETRTASQLCRSGLFGLFFSQFGLSIDRLGKRLG